MNSGPIIALLKQGDKTMEALAIALVTALATKAFEKAGDKLGENAAEKATGLMKNFVFCPERNDLAQSVRRKSERTTRPR